MTKNGHFRRNLAHFKGWLNIAFLVSLFIFSGSFADSHVAKPASTELRLSIAGKTKSAVSLKSFLAKSKSIEFHAGNKIDKIKASLLRYKRLIRVQFDRNINQIVSFKNSEQVLKEKYLPRSADGIIQYPSRG